MDFSLLRRVWTGPRNHSQPGDTRGFCHKANWLVGEGNYSLHFLTNHEAMPN